MEVSILNAKQPANNAALSLKVAKFKLFASLLVSYVPILYTLNAWISNFVTILRQNCSVYENIARNKNFKNNKTS